MDEPRDKRIMSLVHACMDMDNATRQRFLAAECGRDERLRAAVESLLDENVVKTGLHPSTQRLTKVLPEHYKLLHLIGAGGMAEVYLAEDKRLGRKVAIKFLHDALRADPERMLRFAQEARSASALNHPNIITIHDIGESDGIQYIVSEYVDGETLASRMTRGRLSIPEAVDIAIRIASALDSSHRAGVIHRDLKPENIMLRSDGELKVVDFGLAKGSGIFDHHGLAGEMVSTSPGMVIGTPRYMSPEQFRGLPVDGRSDIFSLGIILYEMVTGRMPFPGSTSADILAAILRHDPSPITLYIDAPPKKLIEVIECSLQKDPEARYRSMAALRADLEDLKLDLTLPNRTATQTMESHRTGVSKTTLAVAVIVIMVLMTGGWWYFVGRRPAGMVTPGAMRNVTVTSWSTYSAENVTSASFSPDARMIAFASTRSGASEIWSKPTGSGDPIQVTKDNSRNQYPVWSPDNQQIAFFSKRGDNNSIWSVSFTGGPETEVLGGLSQLARPLRWLADGSIAVQDGSEVLKVTPGSSERQRLLSLGNGPSQPRAIAISADGKAVAVSTKEGEVWKLKYRLLDSETYRDIASSKDSIDQIVFHPNGSSIFYSGGLDGTQQVFQTTLKGDAPIQVSSGQTDVALQDVSSQGDKILCSSINETSDLWSVGLADGRSEVIANEPSEEFWPAFSPDGQTIAYETTPQADRPFRGSVVVKALGSSSSQVVASEGSIPVWSPDGKWLAFFKRTETGVSIWRVRPSGADAKKMADPPVMQPEYYSTPYLITSVSPLAWSRDSSSVAYPAKSGSSAGVFVIAADGSQQPRQIAGDASTTGARCPIWSRDGGSVISYLESKDRPYSLVISPANGGATRAFYTSQQRFQLLGLSDSADSVLIAERPNAADLSPTPVETRVSAVSIATGAVKPATTLKNAYYANLHLSSDGRMLAFVTRSNNVTELWTVPTSGGVPKKVMSDNDPKVLISSLAWAPDGRSIIFGKQTRTNVLSILTN